MVHRKWALGRAVYNIKVVMGVTPDRTRHVVIPDSKPPTMSVSILSAIIKQFAEWTPNFFCAQNIMAGFGFPRKYGATIWPLHFEKASSCHGRGVEVVLRDIDSHI